MALYRRDRINEQLIKELAEILREIKDPRVSGVFLSVTGVDCTADLKYAKIFYSVLGEYDKKELALGLKNASGFIRSQLAQRINLRITPELKFISDDSLKKGDEINKILKNINNIDTVDDSHGE